MRLCLLLMTAVLLPDTIMTEVVTNMQARAWRGGQADSCNGRKGRNQLEDVEAINSPRSTVPRSTVLECGEREFLSSVEFSKFGNDIEFAATTCTSEKCCMVQLSTIEDRVTFTSALKKNIGIQVGTQLDNTVTCKEGGNKILSTAVVCDYASEDGTGWNLLEDVDSLCRACGAGTRYSSRSNTCVECGKGRYSDEGEEECTPCPVDTYSGRKGTPQCTPCPQGAFTDSRKGQTSCTCKDGYRQDGEGCSPCLQGTYSDTPGATECTECPRGRYSDTPGATECTECPSGTHTDSEGGSSCDCDRGLVRSEGDGSVCEYCPAGHTTYRYAPDTCIGPQLHGMDLHRNHLLTLPVSYHTLGNLNGKITRWESSGNWYLKKGDGKKAGRIYQKQTLSYRQGRRNIVNRWDVTAVEPIIRNIYCYVGADKGKRYRGYANRTISGKDCTGPYCTKANQVKVCYCRNRDTSKYDSPYCETAGGGIEYCDIPQCKRGEDEVRDCKYEDEKVVSVTSLATETGYITEVKFPELRSAQLTCDKLGGECTGVWLNNGVVRLTGLTAASLHPTDSEGVASFIAKSPACGNPYYEHYFTQGRS